MKTILVTGGSKGIGKALVFEAALNNYNIIFTYNKSTKEAMKICNKLKDKCKAIKVNLALEQDRSKLFNYLKKKKLISIVLLTMQHMKLKEKNLEILNYLKSEKSMR